jgi:anthranilate phosphoribosyltransferase
MTLEYAQVLGRLLSRTEPAEGEVREAFGAILTGQWTPIQVAGYAVALRMGGESPAVIVEAAQAMRAAMLPVEHALPVVVDTCGTGGDGAHTLNLSSGAALVVAACGLPVAKHGNRSISSRCGSADVFEALGIPLDVPPARQADVLREAGIAFLFAPAHHGALKHAGQARKELGVRTIFNALGPLANPARASHQLVGVYEESLRPVVARALGLLGLRGAWVVRGEDGLDEVSPCEPTRVSELRPDGQVRELTLGPQDFGVERLERSALAGGDAADNAQALLSILEGKRHPAREAVVLNAAAALHVATGEDRGACADKAREALDTGTAMQVLERWRRAASRAKQA